MNLPTILIALAVAVLLGLAIRYLIRNGVCAGCEMGGSCSSKKKKKAAPGECGGKCSACQYYAYEQQLAAAAKARHSEHPKD